MPSPAARVTEVADVFRRAHLRPLAQFDRHYGHHVEVATSDPVGRYIVTPSNVGMVKVRWFPLTDDTALLGLVDTPARAAGLILDHQEGLLP
jgi:hypothetical protein